MVGIGIGQPVEIALVEIGKKKSLLVVTSRE